jgi:uncharacterized membrane protein
VSDFRFTTVNVPAAQGGTIIQGINDLGQLVGAYTIANPADPSTGDPYPQAFLDTSGTITTIGPGGQPYGQNSSATGINNLGQIVGHSGTTKTRRADFFIRAASSPKSTRRGTPRSPRRRGSTTSGGSSAVICRSRPPAKSLASFGQATGRSSPLPIRVPRPRRPTESMIWVRSSAIMPRAAAATPRAFST